MERRRAKLLAFQINKGGKLSKDIETKSRFLPVGSVNQILNILKAI